jgi:hypothetical protein
VNEVDAEALPAFHPPIQMQKWTRRWFHLHSVDEREEVELHGVFLSFPAFLLTRNKPSSSSESETLTRTGTLSQSTSPPPPLSSNGPCGGACACLALVGSRVCLPARGEGLTRLRLAYPLQCRGY